MWCHMSGIDRRDHHHGITHLLCIATLTANNAVNYQSALLRLVKRTNEIDADIFLRVPAPYGEHKDRVLAGGPADFQPGGKDSLPAFIVGPGRQFGDIINRGVGFDPAELAEIVDSMAAVRRAAADADQKEPTSFGTQVSKALAIRSIASQSIRSEI